MGITIVQKSDLSKPRTEERRALVLAGGFAARAMLPSAPDNYAAMLHWRGLIGTPPRN